MRKILLCGSLLGLLVACQFGERDSPSPDEGFIKFLGDDITYLPSDIEPITIGNSEAGYIVVGSAISNQGTNLSIIFANAGGEIVGQPEEVEFRFPIVRNEDGVSESDSVSGSFTVNKIDVFEQGFIIAGTTSLTENSLNIENVSIASIYYASANAEEIRRISIPETPTSATELPGFVERLQNGLNVFGNDIIRLSDGNFLFGGTIEVSRSLDNSNFNTDTDFLIRKYQIDAITGSTTLLFEELIGIEGRGNDERLSRVFEKENGNLIIIGTSSESSALGENNGNNGTNVKFVELSPEGKELYGVSYGLKDLDNNINAIFDEEVGNAIQTESGFAITGTSTISREAQRAFFMRLNAQGEYVSGNILKSNYNANLETRGIGIVQADDKDYIVLGEYLNFSELNSDGNAINRRAGEALFMKVTQSGNRVSETHYGSELGNDKAIDGLLLSDNKILVLANIDFGAGVELVSLIKTNDSGKIVDP